VVLCTVTVITRFLEWRDICGGTESEVFGLAGVGIFAAEDGRMEWGGGAMRNSESFDNQSVLHHTRLSSTKVVTTSFC
jgi:hypothetical protein